MTRVAPRLSIAPHVWSSLAASWGRQLLLAVCAGVVVHVTASLAIGLVEDEGRRFALAPSGSGERLQVGWERLAFHSSCVVAFAVLHSSYRVLAARLAEPQLAGLARWEPRRRSRFVLLACFHAAVDLTVYLCTVLLLVGALGMQRSFGYLFAAMIVVWIPLRSLAALPLTQIALDPVPPTALREMSHRVRGHRLHFGLSHAWISLVTVVPLVLSPGWSQADSLVMLAVLVPADVFARTYLDIGWLTALRADTRPEPVE